MKTELCEIFFKYGSDKCPDINHSYSNNYYKLLHPYKETFTDIIEIGVGNVNLMKPLVGSRYQVGASLKSWRDFFPKANIYGLDIKQEVLFSEERINCFFTDQSKEDSLISTINNIRLHKNEPNLLFDMILDDGSHDVNHMVLSFNTLIKYLKPNGIYIIEDIKITDIDLFKMLESNEMKIVMVHEGINNWDAFIAYKKI
jgi:hypothetical protein